MQSYFTDNLKGKVEKLPIDFAEIRDALQEPRFSAQVFFGIYAFERAGVRGPAMAESPASCSTPEITSPAPPSSGMLFKVLASPSAWVPMSR